MSNEKNAEKSIKERIKELEDKLAAAEAKIAEGEEGALKRVSHALGINHSEITEKEKTRVPEDIVRMNVPYPVRVNANVYQGMVEVPVSTARVIQQALGDRQTRLLNESFGRDNILDLTQGMVAPKVVGKVGITGERIS